MNQDLKRKIVSLAGPLRAATFATAAEWFCQQPQGSTIIETGCYRGAACDGQSTLILALLAKETGGSLRSYDLHQHNIDKSKALLVENGLSNAEFICGDSATTLADAPSEIRFVYLDSYDFEAHKAVYAQAHQLCEVGRLLPKMARASAILLDDCDLPFSGKAGLTVPALLLSGYHETATGYQRLFVRE